MTAVMTAAVKAVMTAVVTAAVKAVMTAVVKAVVTAAVKAVMTAVVTAVMTAHELLQLQANVMPDSLEHSSQNSSRLTISTVKLMKLKKQTFIPYLKENTPCT